MAGTVKHSHITMVNTQHIIIILKYGNSVRITHIHKTYYNSFRVNELTKGGHKLTGQNQHRHQKNRQYSWNGETLTCNTTSYT